MTASSGSPRRLNRRVKIAHVEVGGTLGGSSVCVDVYLRFCGNCFDHDLLFYSIPHERKLECGDRFVIRDLHLPVPVTRSGTATRRSIKSSLKKIPIMRTIARSVLRCLRAARYLINAITIARTLAAGKYDIVHCNNNFDYQPATVIGAWLARKPLVVHYRTPLPISAFGRWLGRRAIAIVAINKNVAEHLVRQGIEDRVVVCADPCEVRDVSRSQALRNELLGSGHSVLVGSVARLEKNKGVEVFLRAVHQLRESFPRVKYIIVGSGSEINSLRTLASELGLDQSIQFTGFVADAFEYLACMDLFVCSSHVEGGPLTVLEAMRLGIPVVTTDVGSVKEWIPRPEYGLVVSPGDPVILAHAIGRLLADRRCRLTIGDNAKRLAGEFCNPLRAAEELDLVFSSVADHATLHPLSDLGGNVPRH